MARFVELDLPDPVREGLASANVRAVAWFELNRVTDFFRGKAAISRGRNPQSRTANPAISRLLRAYTWNGRKSRYETAFIENNLCGQIARAPRQGPKRRAGVSLSHPGR